MIIILTYLISAFIMTIKIHSEGDEFYTKQLQIARQKREELKRKLFERKISPIVFKRELERYSDRATIRTTLWVNYLLAPVLAPLILLSFLLNVLSEIIIITRNI